MSRNLVVIPPIVYNEDTRMTLTVVGDRNDLQALINDFPEEFERRVEQVGDYDHRHATIAAGLTHRQLEAIETAVDLGTTQFHGKQVLKRSRTNLDVQRAPPRTIFGRRRHR